MIAGESGPLVGKGIKFPFQVVVVCWIDFLGYGSMIADAGLNPLHPKASEALARLRIFHDIVALHSGRYFPTLALNDGAVAYRDLSLRSRGPTYDFLMRAWRLFDEIQRRENDRGLPGARVVLATGFRMRGRRAGRDTVSKQFESVLRRYRNGEMQSDQALREAARIRAPFDIIPELQANFAFTKAYVAERSGTRGGLPGPSFFVDLVLFSTPNPPWIRKGETVNWSDERLRISASFAPILGFPPYKHARGGPLEIRDGLQVAQSLTQNPNVLDALRNASKPN